MAGLSSKRLRRRVILVSLAAPGILQATRLKHTARLSKMPTISQTKALIWVMRCPGRSSRILAFQVSYILFGMVVLLFVKWLAKTDFTGVPMPSPFSLVKVSGG